MRREGGRGVWFTTTISSCTEIPRGGEAAVHDSRVCFDGAVEEQDPSTRGSPRWLNELNTVRG